MGNKYAGKSEILKVKFSNGVNYGLIITEYKTYFIATLRMKLKKDDIKSTPAITSDTRTFEATSIDKIKIDVEKFIKSTTIIDFTIEKT